MSKNTEQKSYEDALGYLREHQFDVLEPAGVTNRVFLKKHGVSAAIERAGDGSTRLFAKPGYLLGGEIARLVDKGYQKFLKTTKTEIPATADHLQAIHAFSEELKEATGSISLYNESLGTVSDRYMYDRVEDRDEPKPERPQRPWQAKQPVKTGKRRA